MTALERALDTVKNALEGERLHGFYSGQGRNLPHSVLQDYILLAELAKDPAVVERAAAIHAELEAGTRDPEVEL